MHSPILIKSSSCPVRGRQPLRKCSSFWILCYGITFTTALSPLRVQKDLVSHMVYCKFLSVDSFVSFYHASPSGYFLAFLEHENYTLSKQSLRTVYFKTVSETLIKTYFQVRRISILLRLDRNMTLEWHSNHYHLFRHEFLCTIVFGQFSLQYHLVLGIPLPPSRVLLT